MGFNLGNALAGAVGGFGSGMAMNAKSDIDAQQQAERDRRNSELDTMRATAMAKLQREMTQPDRDQAQANFNRAATTDENYKKGMLDNKTETTRLTGELNDSKAVAVRAKAEADEARARMYGAKTDGTAGGPGGAGKPGKLDQTLTDSEKIHLESLKKREQDLKNIIDPAEREQERINIKREQFGTMGGVQVRVNRDGSVEMQDKSGGYERFKSAADAQAKGFGSDELAAKVQAANDYMSRQKSDASAKSSGAAQNAAANKFAAGPNADRSIRSQVEQPGTPTAPAKPSGFNLADMVSGGYTPPADSPAGQRAARVQAAQAAQQADVQGKATGAESARSMVRENYQSYSPQQAQQVLDTYGSMLTPAELALLQQRIRTAR